MCNTMSTRFVIDDQSSGRGPEWKLSARFNNSKPTQSVSVVGSLPVNKLELVSNISSLTRFPIWAGKKPVNPLSASASSSKVVIIRNMRG